MKNKKVKISENVHKRKTKIIDQNSDKEKPLWDFANVDNDGKFRFHESTLDLTLFVQKLVSLSQMTWANIKMATHDDGKSKNHELPFEKLSQEAKERINLKKLNDDVESIFSFALTNKIRLIGLKKGRIFYVIWYDKNHEFYPIKK